MTPIPTTDEVEVTRETNEGEAKGTNIGDPIAASDGDSDVLLYSIVEDHGGCT